MDTGKRYTPELAVSLKIASDVQMAPGGDWLAFVVAPVGHEETRPTSAIWLADLTTDGQAIPFTTGTVEDRMPRPSPDGSTLAFLSDRDERGSAQVHLIQRGGGEAQSLTSVPRGADHITWTPNGRAITFTAERRALAGEQDPKTDIKVASLADRPRVIARVPVAGGAPQIIGPATGHVWAYSWSGDGRNIAFVSTASNRLDDTVGNVRLGILDPVNRTERTLTTLHRVPSSLSWSPDGTRLVAVVDTGDTPDDTRVVVFDAQSGERTVFDTGETTPLWADWVGDDGSHLLALAADGLWSRLDLLDVATGESHKLGCVPDGGAIKHPASLSEDGRTVALIRETPQGPPEVWAGPLDGELRCLTHLNPQLDGVELAPMEPVEWPASDGLTIQGWLLRPPGAKPGKRLPLIADVHGGPTAVWGATFHATWHDWGQNLAAAGYAVLLPNPRGSTGRGTAFTAMNRNDLGGMDYDDVIRGVDWLIGQGIADPDRLGIAGWSYGGFLSTWAVGHTDRFKAAVAGAAVTNWPSKVGTTDIRPLNEDRFPGPLHEQPDALWERSPIRYLGNITTPTLVVHGEADPRVPVSQGMEFYLGLRAMGVPADFITYPRQKHAFHEKAHQLDVLKRIIGWFDEWIGAEPGG